MAALNFPTSPTVNQTYTANGITYQWDGVSWKATGGNYVASVSGGTTGLTPSTATSGTVTLGGTLNLANGGTGATTAAAARTNLGLAIGTNVQAWDADLDAIAALADTSGFLKKTAANTWTLDTNAYLTGNQNISVTGDATGSGATAIALTLANSGVTAGTYTKLTVDAKGRATAGASLATADLPTTLQTATYAPGLLGSVSASVAAAGTTQPTATVLTSDINIVTSATAGTAIGVSAPVGNAGKYLIVVNRTAVAINVYPATGHAFDGLAVNTPISVPAGGFLEYFGSSATQWHSSYQAVTQGSYVVGAVASANALATTRSISATGDATWSINFDGSANATAALTLASVGTAGTYTKVTTDAKGRVTSGTTLSSADLPTYTGSLTSLQVTTALGFTPYNSTNPNGYITSSGSISGNAATATTASNLTNFAASYSGSYGSADTPANLDVVGYVVQAGLPFSQGDGGIYTAGYSTSWYHQIFGDFRTGQIAIRGKNSGVWQAWRTVLDSSNYSSYALPLSGGTMTGSSTVNGANYIRFGANPTWASTLQVGGDGVNGITRSDSIASVVTTNGNVHIDAGSTRGTYLNWYSGTAGIYFGNGASGQAAYLSSAGAFTAAGSITSSSDERIKTNWRDLADDFIERLAAVKHGIYDRTDIKVTQVGVSAQSLKPVLEEAVLTDNNDMLAVNYGNAALVSAIQLAKRVVQQEARIARLEAMISRLVE